VVFVWEISVYKVIGGTQERMDEEDKVLTVVIDGFVSRFVGWLRSLY
jgi:hypothetical protein